MRWKHTSISIRREVAGPLDIGAALELARRHSIAADGADYRRVADCRLRGDDRVGDVVVDRRVLLLLDLDDGAVVEAPLDNVRLLAGALDIVRRLEGGPELAKLLELDKVPNVGERSFVDRSSAIYILFGVHVDTGGMIKRRNRSLEDGHC